jgi:putative ABC transport system ATP-binding protein
MGSSGSGKTTLLNCVSTIDSVTTGSICIRDKDITAMKNSHLAKFRREGTGVHVPGLQPAEHSYRL